jgi:hypothetical protein
VSGTANVGGLVGNNANGDPDSVVLSYWDSYSTGQAAGIGAGTAPSDLTAVTSDPAQSAATNYAFKQSAYGNFDFTAGNASTGWFMIDGKTRPFGQWEYSTNIANVHQLQLMAMDLGAGYKLAANVDFSSGLAVGGKYPGMWGSTGFSPIGDLSSPFTGTFDGQGHVISNLAINLPSTSYVGLFGYTTATSTLSNVSLQAATVTGLNRVGILAGMSLGTISNVSATGAVAATGYGGGLAGESQGSIANSSAAVTVAGTATTSSPMGGLVGWNNGAGIIQDSYATGNVTAGTGNTRAGGLAGQNNGAILRSHATGAVSGGNQGVGGLVGYNSSGTPNASIVDSYATGAVIATAYGGGLVGLNAAGASVNRSYATGSANVTAAAVASSAGGLIGNNSGIVTQSYATGAANTRSDSPTATAGGLIGTNSSSGTVTQSYATGAATSAIMGSGTSMAGGLVGRNLSGGAVTQSYATGAATATAAAGTAMAGGLIGSHSGTGAITQTYATGAVSAVSPSGTAAIGGLIGSVTGTGAVTSSYWDIDTSGTMSGAGSGAGTGIVGLTTAQMQNPPNLASTYTGWDFAVIWSAPSVGYYPQLYGVNYVLRVNPANASRVYGEANPAFTYSIYGLHAGDTAGIINGLGVSTAATATSNAGAYAINASGGSAVSASGQAYRFIDAPGTLTVTPRAITVTADAKSRAYGDANPALTYQVGGSGLVNGDTLSGALATSATAVSNIGVYGITQGTLGSPNYTISSFAGANLTVTPRAITVTADTKSRAYGDANPALTYQVGGAGLVNGDALSGALTTSATTSSNVGTYAIGQGTVTASGNYALNYVSANLAVTPRAITVAADAKSRAYGDVNPALTYQVGGSGLVNGDTLSGGLATSATAVSNVGVFGITQGTLGSPNYTISAFTGANLTITPRTITVRADAKSRTYGDANPALTYQVGGSGLVNGDTLSGALATSATTASTAGVYGITQGTLAASSNYAFTFVGANLTVTPAATTPTIRVPTAEFGSYVQSQMTLLAPQPREQKREVVSIELAPAAIICKSRKCLELPHPHNRRVGERARFVDTTASRDRLPAFAEN